MAEEVGLDCEVYSTEKLHELKMGAFWSVSQGSAEPPALIVLRYEPQGVTDGPVLGLVGKGITFDTGGISIKPADNMEKMKYDMAGGAAMLGAMRAIALLKPKVRVIGIVCAAENMPDGKAQKPGDVQTAMPPVRTPGKTIEIINTDAEGRLVLADGLTYARAARRNPPHRRRHAHRRNRRGPRQRSTPARSPTTTRPMRNLQAALATSGEKFWRMPLGDEYAEHDQVRHRRHQEHRRPLRAEPSPPPSSCTSSPKTRRGFTSTSPAWPGSRTTRPYIAKGPSGVAVRSILEWVRSY